MARTHTVTRTDLTEHGNLRVGMTVNGPGRGPLNGPRERGTLIGLHVLHFARGDGYFAEVKRDDGTTYTTACGLVSPVEDSSIEANRVLALACLRDTIDMLEADTVDYDAAYEMATKAQRFVTLANLASLRA